MYHCVFVLSPTTCSIVLVTACHWCLLCFCLFWNRASLSFDFLWFIKFPFRFCCFVYGVLCCFTSCVYVFGAFKHDWCLYCNQFSILSSIVCTFIHIFLPVGCVVHGFSPEMECYKCFFSTSRFDMLHQSDIYVCYITLTIFLTLLYFLYFIHKSNYLQL